MNPDKYRFATPAKKTNEFSILEDQLTAGAADLKFHSAF